MSDNEHRQIARDSLFVMADLRIDGIEGEHRVKIRNLSSGGLMAEAAITVFRGQLIWINLRNIGWVEGSVAWVQENRFGVAFRDEIDPREARQAGPLVKDQDNYTTRRSIYATTRPHVTDGGASGNLRKI